RDPRVRSVPSTDVLGYRDYVASRLSTSHVERRSRVYSASSFRLTTIASTEPFPITPKAGPLVAPVATLPCTVMCWIPLGMLISTKLKSWLRNDREICCCSSAVRPQLFNELEVQLANRANGASDPLLLPQKETTPGLVPCPSTDTLTTTAASAKASDALPVKRPHSIDTRMNRSFFPG